MSRQGVRVLVPPRPNLGPEPWAEEPASVLPLLSAGIALLVLLAGLIGFFFYRRRRARHRTDRPSPAEALPVTPADRILNLAGLVREDLVTRFGPSLRARTTEEIAADLHVKEVLGVEHFEPVIRLLALADHCKFAASPEDGDPLSLLDEISELEALHSDLVPRPAEKRQREAESR